MATAQSSSCTVHLLSSEELGPSTCPLGHATSWCDRSVQLSVCQPFLSKALEKLSSPKSLIREMSPDTRTNSKVFRSSGRGGLTRVPPLGFRTLGESNNAYYLWVSARRRKVTKHAYYLWGSARRRKSNDAYYLWVPHVGKDPTTRTTAGFRTLGAWLCL